MIPYVKTLSSELEREIPESWATSFSVQVHTSFLNHAETVSLTLGGH